MSGCAAANSDPCVIPAWPVAGPEVAAELERIDPSQIPATTEWLDRIGKLHDQLEAAR